jgi:hypothetical protein
MQRQAALELIESFKWGDMVSFIRDTELALRLALDATVEYFWQWEDNMLALEQRFGDEFSLTPGDVESLGPQMRLAYVARLLRSLALIYGVKTEFGGHSQDRDGPAALLSGLNEILETRDRKSVIEHTSRDVPERLSAQQAEGASSGSKLFPELAEPAKADLKTYVVEITSPTLGDEIDRISNVRGPLQAIRCASSAQIENPHGELEVTFRARLYMGEDIEFAVEG